MNNDELTNRVKIISDVLEHEIIRKLARHYKEQNATIVSIREDINSSWQDFPQDWMERIVAEVEANRKLEKR